MYCTKRQPPHMKQECLSTDISSDKRQHSEEKEEGSRWSLPQKTNADGRVPRLLRLKLLLTLDKLFGGELIASQETRVEVVRCLESMMVLDKEDSVSLVSFQSREKPRGCAGCNGKIRDRFMLQALDCYWHEDCLKCACCDCRLGRVGSTLYTRANLILCRQDYLRLFGVTGKCAACTKLIPAFEMVMRARDNVYHLDCFACQLCRQRFCVGDRFFLKNNMILCQLDYEGGHLNDAAERLSQ